MRSPRRLSGGKRFSLYRFSAIALGLSVLGAFGVMAIYASTPTSPVGPTGNWALAFNDEFDGTSIDRTKWDTNWYGEGGNMNGVGTYSANVTESGGTANLVLASSGSGALIHTNYTSGRYALPVGSYAEARVQFAGNGSSCYNWAAWWASGPSWPSAGEHDIAEVLSSQLTVNYHSPSGSHNQGAISGNWCGAFHTYGVWRKAGSAEVYWDGVKVKSYSTDDNGGAEELIFNVGKGSSYGNAGMMKIDWVRAWKPSSTPFSASPTASSSTTTPTPSSSPTPVACPTPPNTTDPGCPGYYTAGATVLNDATTGTGLNQFSFSSGWQTSTATGPYMGDNHFSKTVGSTYQIQFSGTQAKIYSEKNIIMGIFAVSVDGGTETLVDGYASSRQDQQLLYSSPTLTSGTHTLKVRVTGTKNASSTDSYVTADRVDIISGTSSPSPTPVSGLPGDINNNGKVDVFDLSTVLSRWDTADSACDINKDGIVNVFDLSLLLSNWGKNVSAL